MLMNQCKVNLYTTLGERCAAPPSVLHYIARQSLGASSDDAHGLFFYKFN